MKRGNIIAPVLSIILILGLAIADLNAQAGRGKGRQRGFVLDEADAPVNGAKVELVFKDDAQVKFETTTNEKGEFTFANLGTGDWKLTASKTGFIPFKKMIHISQMERNPEITLKLEKSQGAIISDNADIIDQGNVLFNEGKYEEAIATFRDFQSKTPDFFEIHLNIGNCFLKMEKYDEALAEFDEYIKKAVDTTPEIKAKALAATGEIHLKKGDMAKAQEFFKQSVDLNPKDEVLAYNVGEIFFSNNNFEEALKYFTLASQIKPEWSVSYLKLGYVYSNTGDMKAAVTNFNKFLELDPSNPEAESIKELVKSLAEH